MESGLRRESGAHKREARRAPAQVEAKPRSRLGHCQEIRDIARWQFRSRGTRVRPRGFSPARSCFVTPNEVRCSKFVALQGLAVRRNFPARVARTLPLCMSAVRGSRLSHPTEPANSSGGPSSALPSGEAPAPAGAFLRRCGRPHGASPARVRSARRARATPAVRAPRRSRVRASRNPIRGLRAAA